MTQTIDPATTSPPAPMPTVFDLGRHLVDQWSRLNLHDERMRAAREDSRECCRAEADHAAVNAEIDVTEALIFTRPVESLADAAALASLGFRMADRLHDLHGLDRLANDTIAQLRAAFARITLHLSEAAAVPFALIGSGNNLDYVARHATTGEARP